MKAYYKCRLCGELCNGEETTSDNSIPFIKMTWILDDGKSTEKKSQTALQYSLHFCADGSCGIADLQGFKNED